MKRHLLARIPCPSGLFMVMDGASAGLWSHGHPPHHAEHVDLVISGPDADEAGRRFDRDWNPLRIHDVPREDADELAAAFVAFCTRQNLDATIAVAPENEPFRARLAALSPPGGGVSFLGNWAAIVAGVPTDGPFELFAEEEAEHAPSEGRWRRVRLEIAPSAEVVRSVELGRVMSDSGRLLWGDADAMGRWREDESLDGLGDCVFWGPDAGTAAQALGAVALESRTYGWTDQPVNEARRLVKAVAKERDERGLRLTLDPRPHSHHYRAIVQIRESPLGAGTVDVDGTHVAAFASTWGDGVWPVFADLDAAGQLVSVRLEFAADEAPTLH